MSAGKGKIEITRAQAKALLLGKSMHEPEEYVPNCEDCRRDRRYERAAESLRRKLAKETK